MFNIGIKIPINSAKQKNRRAQSSCLKSRDAHGIFARFWMKLSHRGYSHQIRKTLRFAYFCCSCLWLGKAAILKKCDEVIFTRSGASKEDRMFFAFSDRAPRIILDKEWNSLTAFVECLSPSGGDGSDRKLYYNGFYYNELFKIG